jgi:hypothetical protein
MGIGTMVAGIVVIALVLSRRLAQDLGSISDHWIVEHRVDSP